MHLIHSRWRLPTIPCSIGMPPNPSETGPGYSGDKADEPTHQPVSYIAMISLNGIA